MRKLFYSLLFLSLSIGNLFAQENLPYQQPPIEILQLADANLPPSVYADRKGENAFFFYRNRYKSIAELSEIEMRLGGLRINPKTNINSRQSYFDHLSAYNLKTSKEQEIKGLPSNGKFANVIWNRNQTKIAFTNTT